MQALRRTTVDLQRVVRLLQTQSSCQRPLCILPSLAVCFDSDVFLWGSDRTSRQAGGNGGGCPANIGSRTTTTLPHLWPREAGTMAGSPLQHQISEGEQIAGDKEIHEEGETRKGALQNTVSLPQEHMPPELRDVDWTSEEDRKVLVERLMRGELDLFRGPSYVDTSVPEQEMEDWQRDFRMKVVDVNRTSRGSPTGGIGRFSALVVVGNSNGIIGLGSGKSLAMGDAIKKANRQALKTLFFVPRYRRATILHPVVARYGKCKVTMYPRSTGAGCKASDMVSGICKLAGIQDIGVKVHGTRNVRNTVKALIRGFESQVVEEELRDVPSNQDAQTANRFLLTLPKGTPAVEAIGLSN